MSDETEEKAKANEIKEKALRAVEQMAGVLAEAQRAGMEVSIGQIGVDAFGRMMPIHIQVKRVLA